VDIPTNEQIPCSLSLTKIKNMSLIINVLIGLIALIHIYILWFEMFAWTTRGPKVFRSFPKDLFPPTKAMAANQGLYNGFLAAGLIWTFFIQNAEWQQNAENNIIRFRWSSISIYRSFKSENQLGSD